jgi:hypothetical protein
MLSAYLALQIGIKNKYSPPAKDREKKESGHSFPFCS